MSDMLHLKNLKDDRLVLQRIMDVGTPYPLVALERAQFDLNSRYGYIVAENAEFFLVQRVSDRLDLDGYAVLRRADVTAVETCFELRALIETALLLKRQCAMRPAALDLSSMSAAMDSAQREFGVLMISREFVVSGAVDVGTVKRATEKEYLLQWLSAQATWETNEHLHCYGDVTMLEFGGEYERTLVLVAREHARKDL